MIRKIFLSFLLLSSIYLLTPRPAQAAIITINSKGEVIWQVLGSEVSSLSIPKQGEITVKNIATSTTPPTNMEIALSQDNGKISLSVDGQNQVNLVGSQNPDLVEIEQRGDTNQLKIGSSDNKFIIQEKEIRALTSFPITINPNKNELSVKTNSVMRLISILPYEAILSLIRANIINKTKSNDISLTESSKGELQYEINGERNINLFNLAKIDVPVTSQVSASTGEVLKVDQPTWLKILGFLFT